MGWGLFHTCFSEQNQGKWVVGILYVHVPRKALPHIGFERLDLERTGRGATCACVFLAHSAGPRATRFSQCLPILGKSITENRRDPGAYTACVGRCPCIMAEYIVPVLLSSRRPRRSPKDRRTRIVCDAVIFDRMSDRGREGATDDQKSSQYQARVVMFFPYQVGQDWLSVIRQTVVKLVLGRPWPIMFPAGRRLVIASQCLELVVHSGSGVSTTTCNTNVGLE